MAAAGAGGGSVASTAYLIMGHGEEGEMSEDTVPEGCYLVVGAQAGEISYLSAKADFNLFFNNFDQDIYLNPVANSRSLFKRHGSFAVYGPGMHYPNFKYELAFYWENKGKLSMRSSGLKKWPFNDSENVKEKFSKETVIQGNNIASHEPRLDRFYNDSVFPTRDMVKNMLRISHLDKLTNFYKTELITKYLTFTQKQLFDLVNSGVLEPGVFYNFVCRKKEGVPFLSRYATPHGEMLLIAPELRMKLFEKHGEENRARYFRELNEAVRRGKSIHNLAYPLPRTINSNTRKLILKHIGEAEFHRRPYMATALPAGAADMQELLRENYKELVRTVVPLVLTEETKRERLLTTVRALKRNGLRLSGYMGDTESPLLFSVKMRAKYPLSTTLPTLLDAGVSLNDVEYANGDSLIHGAVRELDIALVEVLLETGADPNKQNGNGNTALHLAVARPWDAVDIEKQARILTILLHMGADPNMLNKQGLKPISLIRSQTSELLPILAAHSEGGMRRRRRRATKKRGRK